MAQHEHAVAGIGRLQDAATFLAVDAARLFKEQMLAGSHSSVRDVPRSGERFRPGQPICSVFATAAGSAACYRLLVSRAARVYAELEPVRRSACRLR